MQTHEQNKANLEQAVEHSRELSRLLNKRDDQILALKADLAAANERAEKAEGIIAGVYEQLPESCQVSIREGAGHVDPAASLAVSSAKLAGQLTTAQAELDELRGKLPESQDKVRVVPNVDPVWINPSDPHWMGEDPFYGRWDEDDNLVPSPPVQIKTWAHYGDQLCVLVEGEDEMRHWDGPFFSTREAAEAARQEGDSDG